MQLWQDGVIAMLAAIGLASMIWTVVKAVLFAGPERRVEIAALVPVQGEGEGLEEQLRFLQGMREEQRMFGRALVVDCGLSEEGRKLARMLVRKHRWAALCGKDEVGDYLGG